jgi:hypothetical protein
MSTEIPKNFSADLELNFPEAPDFISEPPQYTVAEMILLCEKMLPYWNTQRYAAGSPYLEPVKMEEFRIFEEEQPKSLD